MSSLVNRPRILPSLWSIESGDRGWNPAEIHRISLSQVTHVDRLLHAVEIHGRDRHIRLDVIAHHDRTSGRERDGCGPLGDYAGVPTEIIAEEEPLEAAEQRVAHILLSDFN